MAKGEDWMMGKTTLTKREEHSFNKWFKSYGMNKGVRDDIAFLTSVSWVRARWVQLHKRLCRRAYLAGIKARTHI